MERARRPGLTPAPEPFEAEAMAGDLTAKCDQHRTVPIFFAIRENRLRHEFNAVVGCAASWYAASVYEP